jgi:uncharacterized protein (DUF4415 family)
MSAGWRVVHPLAVVSVCSSLRSSSSSHAAIRSFRVDPGVLDQFRKEARRRRAGFQTLINEVLARHLRKDVA